MTVRDLITELQKVPQESQIYCDDRTTGYIITDVGFYDHDNQSIITIEGVPNTEEI